jgi:RsiW-degrading membrane proteinase PrsW (M82 family)
MSLIFISIAIGVLAVGLVYLDHVFIRNQDTSEIDRSILIKIFLLGFVSSYLGGSLMEPKSVMANTIEKISDTIKIGRPSF